MEQLTSDTLHLFLGKIADPGQFEPFSLNGVSHKHQPHQHANQCEEGGSQEADDGHRARQQVGDGKDAEGQQGLKGMEYDVTASFF